MSTVCKINYLDTAEQAVKTNILSTNEIPEEYSCRMRKTNKDTSTAGSQGKNPICLCC